VATEKFVTAGVCLGIVLGIIGVVAFTPRNPRSKFPYVKMSLFDTHMRTFWWSVVILMGIWLVRSGVIRL